MVPDSVAAMSATQRSFRYGIQSKRKIKKNRRKRKKNLVLLKKWLTPLASKISAPLVGDATGPEIIAMASFVSQKGNP